jgi:NAD(P)-dependent dehydrogenase (short-subunit alcohol dehydrogenase family)
MMTWRDQVALVTGSARGIGRATARLPRIAAQPYA